MENNAYTIYDTLPPITLSLEDSTKQKVLSLEPIRPGFFVPKLDNKPQNPIIDTLEIEFARTQRIRQNDGKAAPLANGATFQFLENGVQPHFDRDNPLRINLISDDHVRSDVWVDAAASFKADDTLLKTWDDLRPNYNHKDNDGALLSEQPPAIFDSLQEFVVPHVRVAKTTTAHIPLGHLLEVLMVNLVGHSSRHYDWDSAAEKFRPSESYVDKVAIASGYTESTTHSLIQLCLGIGACLRRLDELIDSMRVQTLHPTMHAFLHALETVLSLLRKQLTRAKQEVLKGTTRLSLYLTDIKTIFQSLGELCCLEPSSITSSRKLPKDASSLLSHVYAFLELHIQSFSPLILRAILAYILTTTCNPYFRAVEKSIGIGKSQSIKSLSAVNPAGLKDEDLEEQQPNEIFEVDDQPESYPGFFSAELKAQVISANRGLKVLAAAHPDHPLLKESIERQCRWIWQEHEVEAIYTAIREPSFTHEEQSAVAPSPTEPNVNINLDEAGQVQYKPELAHFRVFDQEPGSQFKPSETGVSSIVDTITLQTFLATFPEDLPVSTPSLSHLSSAVLYPLQLQSNRLSKALLDLFLAPPLSLPSHFSLLRSFLLLSSQNFTYRLRNSLFSESESYQPVGRGTRARTRARLGIKNDKDVAAEAEELNAADGLATTAKWGIGLGIGLSERGEWPPGGAELGFALRRVIVDSLDKIHFNKGRILEHSTSIIDEDTNPGDMVVKEAEWRLGFAIRDLPVDEGREEWLNPSSLAALDFLYLDYKPPRPVAALITEDILSKYQRIFTFLLRLLRVETVSRGLFHSIQRGPDPFPNNAVAAGLTRRFRFFTHSFVSTLISYVFDTAIGVHLDKFMARLEEISEKHAMMRFTATSEAQAQPTSVHSDDKTKDEQKLEPNNSSYYTVDGDSPPVADVFEIMLDHSRVMDKVLSGCMLRTQQRAISDVVDDILGIILRFGGLIRDLKRHATKEEEAAAQLQKLHYNFERKMITFTKVLRAMDDKSELRSLLSALASNDRDYEVLSRNAGGQKREIGLSDLLARLDPGEWWKVEMERKAKAKRDKEKDRAISD